MLTKVESSILDQILQYLSPKSLLNLALTNYKFYEPVLPFLYRHLIVVQGVLFQKSARKHHFQHFSIINGFNNDDSRKDMVLIDVKLTRIIESITNNPKLANYIRILEVFGTYNNQIKENLVRLLKLTNCKVYIDDKKLRIWLKKQVKFNSIVIDHEQDFQYATDEVDIRINHMTNYEVLTRFKHIRLTSELIKNLCKLSVVLKPISINITGDTDYNNIDFTDIKNLSIEIKAPNQWNIPVNWSQLNKLVIYESNQYDHNLNEAIDINLMKFLNTAPFKNLTYFTILYNPPLHGNIIDGFEGNYLRRVDILNTLVKIISNWSTPKINLILPNYLQVLSCYEQPMNNLMWNGCRCNHCEEYLGLLDEFVHRHKYFSEQHRFWKDLDNLIVLCLVNQYFSKRYLSRDHFHYLHPLRYKNWNIHVNHFSPIEFQCFELENVKHSEYDQEDEIFFDSLSQLEQCEFNTLFKSLNVCMVHYLDDLIYPLIDLSRGNAESFELVQRFLNDGEETINLQMLNLNGFIFCFDKELNGTNFFVGLYD